ncbi:hypothetical protein [Flavobacterium sp.]|jgi:hypothetical protein|uniref:hypothetical protein n=1 Tax=Flavobacterium sp. TaxID=239 RepID=UPI0037BE22BE
MKTKLLTLFLIFIYSNIFGQCDIKTVNRPDGNTIKYFNPKPIIIQEQFEVGTAIYKNVTTGKMMINLTILFKSLPNKPLNGELIIQTTNKIGITLKLIKSEEVEMNGKKVAIGLYEIDNKSIVELKKYPLKSIYFSIDNKKYGQSISKNNNIYINELNCF